MFLFSSHKPYMTSDLCWNLYFFFSDVCVCSYFFFFFSSRRRHTRSDRDWSSDVCSSDLSTLPSNVLYTGGCSGFRVDTISQLGTNGAVRFVLILGDSLSVTTAPQLPGGQWGYAYSRVLNAACGAGSYAWAVDSATPPPGMALSSTGVLGGPPTDTGTYVVRVSA